MAEQGTHVPLTYVSMVLNGRYVRPDILALLDEWSRAELGE